MRMCSGNVPDYMALSTLTAYKMPWEQSAVSMSEPLVRGTEIPENGERWRPENAPSALRKYRQKR